MLANNSRWISFTTVRNESWVHENVVLLGDAAHTAHFSIGSGTKLAMEDSLALAACLHEEPTVAEALATYDEERQAVVLSTQRAAQASLEWFENLGQYVHQEPTQFAFNIMTRSRRVTYDNLRVRDPGFVARCEAWYADEVGVLVGRAEPDHTPPMFQPVTLRAATGPGLTLHNRVIVSPMDQYVARGRPADRLPPRAPRRQGARRGRPGDDRDDLRVARRGGSPSAAAACGPTSSATGGHASSTSCTARPPRRSAASSATRARRARRS